MTQKQSGGMGSTNTQIGTVNIGLGYNDVKEIAKDIFNENFSRLASHAASVAERRAEIIRDEIISELSSRSDVRLDSFEEPEKQVALLEAQKSFALSGDEELKKMLVKTVVEISKQSERSLKSIVLQEALKILPQLTSHQMKIISLVFAVRYVKWGTVNNLDDIYGIFFASVGCDLNGFIAKDGDFRHIQYCRCGNSELNSHLYQEVLRGNYPGILLKGITNEEMEKAFQSVGCPPYGLIPALTDNTKMQIAALDNNVIMEKSTKFAWTKEQIAISEKLFRSNIMEQNEVSKYLEEKHQNHFDLLKYWNGSQLSRFSLTSVGAAIAHSYIEGNGLAIGDLDIWL